MFFEESEGKVKDMSYEGLEQLCICLQQGVKVVHYFCFKLCFAKQVAKNQSNMYSGFSQEPFETILATNVSFIAETNDLMIWCYAGPMIPFPLFRALSWLSWVWTWDNEEA